MKPDKKDFYIDDQGVIREKLLGVVDEEFINGIQELVTPLIQQLRSQNKPILILADASQVGKSTTGGRKASLEMLKTLGHDKIAQYGLKPYLTTLTNIITKASGIKNVKVFAKKEDALNWLLAK